jgi:hypothetical protein
MTISSRGWIPLVERYAPTSRFGGCQLRVTFSA